MHWPFQLCNTSKNWTIKARDARRITAAAMKCIKKIQQAVLGQIVQQIQ